MPIEADGFEWTTLSALTEAVAQRPTHYSAWFRIYLSDHTLY